MTDDFARMDPSTTSLLDAMNAWRGAAERLGPKNASIMATGSSTGHAADGLLLVYCPDANKSCDAIVRAWLKHRGRPEYEAHKLQIRTGDPIECVWKWLEAEKLPHCIFNLGHSTFHIRMLAIQGLESVGMFTMAALIAGAQIGGPANAKG